MSRYPIVSYLFSLCYINQLHAQDRRGRWYAWESEPSGYPTGYPNARDDNGYLTKDDKLLRPVFMLRGWMDEWSEIDQYQKEQEEAKESDKKNKKRGCSSSRKKTESTTTVIPQKGGAAVEVIDWAERIRSVKRAKKKAFKKEFGAGFLQIWPPPIVVPLAKVCFSTSGHSAKIEKPNRLRPANKNVGIIDN